MLLSPYYVNIWLSCNISFVHIHPAIHCNNYFSIQHARVSSQLFPSNLLLENYFSIQHAEYFLSYSTVSSSPGHPAWPPPWLPKFPIDSIQLIDRELLLYTTRRILSQLLLYTTRKSKFPIISIQFIARELLLYTTRRILSQLFHSFLLPGPSCWTTTLTQS